MTGKTNIDSPATTNSPTSQKVEVEELIAKNLFIGLLVKSFVWNIWNPRRKCGGFWKTFCSKKGPKCYSFTLSGYWHFWYPRQLCRSTKIGMGQKFEFYLRSHENWYLFTVLISKISKPRFTYWVRDFSDSTCDSKATLSKLSSMSCPNAMFACTCIHPIPQTLL